MEMCRKNWNAPSAAGTFAWFALEIYGVIISIFFFFGERIFLVLESVNHLKIVLWHLSIGVFFFLSFNDTHISIGDLENISIEYFEIWKLKYPAYWRLSLNWKRQPFHLKSLCDNRAANNINIQKVFSIFLNQLLLDI